MLPIVAAGCHTDMWRQPRDEAYAESTFYSDGQSTRPLVPGTIARDHLREDGAYFTGAANGRYIDRFPAGITVNAALLDRGQERFDVYCSPCHGRLGNGQGMIAHRGLTLKRPVGNYHTDRLRRMPIGHFYDVITNGYGTMYSYASRVEPQDRWAIVAYIRALQLSQDGRSGDVPGEALTRLQTDPKAVVRSETGAAKDIYGTGPDRGLGHAEGESPAENPEATEVPR
ncbi:cytochrome c [bacterium]|nr:MAG: cytochrome c [bacterium]